MSGPVIFVSHHKIKDGKLKEYIELTGQVVEDIKIHKPGTLVHLTFTNIDGSVVSHVHVFPDAEAFDKHIEGVGDRTSRAFQYIEPRAMELYGALSDEAKAMFEEYAESGIEVTFNPNYHAGYMRFQE
jgi:hypothetical protein